MFYRPEEMPEQPPSGLPGAGEQEPTDRGTFYRDRFRQQAEEAQRQAPVEARYKEVRQGVDEGRRRVLRLIGVGLVTAVVGLPVANHLTGGGVTRLIDATSSSISGEPPVPAVGRPLIRCDDDLGLVSTAELGDLNNGKIKPLHLANRGIVRFVTSADTHIGPHPWVDDNFRPIKLAPVGPPEITDGQQTVTLATTHVPLTADWLTGWKNVDRVGVVEKIVPKGDGRLTVLRFPEDEAGRFPDSSETGSLAVIRTATQFPLEQRACRRSIFEEESRLVQKPPSPSPSIPGRLGNFASQRVLDAAFVTADATGVAAGAGAKAMNCGLIQQVFSFAVSEEAKEQHCGRTAWTASDGAGLGLLALGTWFAWKKRIPHAIARAVTESRGQG